MKEPSSQKEWEDIFDSVVSTLLILAPRGEEAEVEGIYGITLMNGLMAVNSIRIAKGHEFYLDELILKIESIDETPCTKECHIYREYPIICDSTFTTKELVSTLDLVIKQLVGKCPKDSIDKELLSLSSKRELIKLTANMCVLKLKTARQLIDRSPFLYDQIYITAKNILDKFLEETEESRKKVCDDVRMKGEAALLKKFFRNVKAMDKTIFDMDRVEEASQDVGKIFQLALDASDWIDSLATDMKELMDRLSSIWQDKVFVEI